MEHIILKDGENKMVRCEFFVDGKCIQQLDESAECNDCGKPLGTCALLCDCEEETCNIGQREK